jgi:hypothetical protein
MAYYSFISYIYILLIFHYSIELTSSTNDLVGNNYSQQLPLFIHPLHFISHICQRQKQYPLKITRKFCSIDLQKQQQRDKRVGWTISV